MVVSRMHAEAVVEVITSEVFLTNDTIVFLHNINKPTWFRAILQVLNTLTGAAFKA